MFCITDLLALPDAKHHNSSNIDMSYFGSAVVSRFCFLIAWSLIVTNSFAAEPNPDTVGRKGTALEAYKETIHGTDVSFEMLPIPAVHSRSAARPRKPAATTTRGPSAK